MARRLLLAATGVIALAAAGLGTTAANAAAPAASSAKITTVHSCAKASRGHAQCYAVARIDAAAAAATARMASGAKGGVNPNVTPSGYGPTDLRSAYKLTTSGSSSQTVAIVDAYDDPNAEADLGDLPVAVRPSGVHDRERLLQEGQPERRARAAIRARTAGGRRRSPSTSTWSSAICPGCHILLVEATTPSFANLGAAVNRAAAMGATVISNSYGGSDASDASYGSYYRHPGIAVTVSCGDNGYGVEYPASSYYVTAVGGTHLVRSSTSSGWTETAWSRGRQRLLRVQHEAVLADGHELQQARGRRRLGGRRPGHRRRRLRLHGVPGPLRLARVRRDQRVVPDHRVGVRAGGQRGVGRTTALTRTATRRRSST